MGLSDYAACSRRPRHTDGVAGADVPRRVAIGDEDLEAAACVLVVRRVGEERLQALNGARHTGTDEWGFAMEVVTSSPQAVQMVVPSDSRARLSPPEQAALGAMGQPYDGFA